MTRQHSVLAVLLKQKFPLLKSMHCMAHRLELAVKNAVDTVDPVSHFQDLIDAIYKVFSQSPKNQRENEHIASQLSVHLLKVQKVFDVRWVFSSFLALQAILRDFPALYTYFTNSCSSDSDKCGRDKSKFSGLA